MSRKLLYLAPYFRRWEDLHIDGVPWGLQPLRPPKGCPGCCLVFDNMDALLELYPDADPDRCLFFEEPEVTREE